MDGIEWALSSTPPKEAYQAVCESDDEGEAKFNRAKSFAKFVSQIDRNGSPIE